MRCFSKYDICSTESSAGNLNGAAADGSYRRRCVKRRRGFTLVEMMLVIALAATLMAMLASSLLQARNAARRAKAESELREMVNAFIQYFNTYGEWPPNAPADETDVSEEFLQPLLDPNDGANPLGVVFLNKTFTEIERARSRNKYGKEYYLDPWMVTYKMSFSTAETSGEGSANKIKHTTSIWFPNNSRRW